MLVRLLPEQVSYRWDMIKKTIADTAPPYADTSAEAMNNVLMSLLNGIMQCWVSIGDDKKIDAILTTSIEEDAHSKTKNLLIYSILALRQTHGKSWIEGFEALNKFASSEGCEAIIAITKEEKVIKIAERFGGDTEWRYIRVPINPTL